MPAMSATSNSRGLRDASLSTFAAGFVTVLVGFASSAVIVFQAAQSLGASPAEISSWMWALGLGMGLTCIGLSLRYRMPVVTAWSTPGAAMLISSAAGLPLSDAIGRRKVFVICGATVYAIGLWIIASATSYSTFLIGMATTGVGHGLYFAVDLALLLLETP